MRSATLKVVSTMTAIWLIAGLAGCYPFEIADFPDSAPDGGDWPCEPGWAGTNCNICARFVRTDATADAADGLTWLTAFPTVADGIAAAAEAVTGAPESCEVWVAAGTYYVYGTSNADTVQLQPGVALYGGFAGQEIDRADRDWQMRATVLDGRDGPDGAHQVFHVVTGADDAVIDGFTITGGNADRGTDPLDPNNWGGGMINVGCSPTVRNCHFLENRAYFGGGMENIKIDDGGALVPANPLISNCSFWANVASGIGGAMDNDYSSPTIEDTSFGQNHAGLGGGAMNNMYGSPTIDGCEFRENSTAGTEGANGGALMNWSEQPEISNSRFIENSAWRGGAIVNESSSPIIEGCSFEHNEATEAGGAISSVTSATEIRDSTFVGNAVDEYGGALANLDGSAPLIEGSLFYDNTASDGAGIYNEQSAATITDSVFVQNVATWGAGISNMETSGVQIDGCQFLSNHAVQGGGAIDSWACAPVTTRAIFTGNSAAVGGAVYLSGVDDARFESCLFYDNRAVSGGGGAIRSRENSTSTVVNCTFYANRAGEPGGAIHTGSSSDLALINSISWNDLPDEIFDDTLGVTTVSYSDVEGGAAGDGNQDADPLLKGDPWITSSWSSSSYDEGIHQSALFDESADWETNELAGMLLRPSPTEHVLLTILSNDATSMRVWGDQTAIAVTGTLFEIYDLHLGSGSPCIDAADGAVAPATDLAGRVRVDLPNVANTGVGTPSFADLGAYEHYPSNLIGPDEFGYIGVTDDDLAACADITTSGTPIVGMGDDASVEVALGFTFPFYGVDEELVSINSNGLLTFGGEMPNSFVNNPLPAGVLPAIFPHWDDLDPTLGGGVYHQSAGQLFTVQWNVPAATESELLDVRVVLDGVTGEIHFCYVDTDAGAENAGADATAGIQGSSPVVALQYSHNQPVLVTGLHLRFVPPS